MGQMLLVIHNLTAENRKETKDKYKWQNTAKYRHLYSVLYWETHQ